MKKVGRIGGYVKLLCGASALVLMLSNGIWAQVGTIEIPAPTTLPVTRHVEITKWTEQPAEFLPGVKERIRRFESKNPDIKVKLVPVVWGKISEKMTLAAATGTGPDISPMWWNKISPLVAMGALVNLEPYIAKSKLVKDEISPNAINISREITRGDAYFIPDSAGHRVVYYLRDWFMEAGVSEPDPEWTWDDFRMYAKKFTNSAENKYGFTMRGGFGFADWALVPMFSYANDRRFFDENGECLLNSPGAIEGLQMYVDLHRKDKITPPTAPTDAYSEITGNFWSRRALFLAHVVTTLPAHIERLGAESVGAVPMPRVPDTGVLYQVTGYDGFAMWESSKHKEEAWRYIEFVMSQEGQSWKARTRGLGIPTNYKVRDEGWFKYSQYYPRMMVRMAETEMLYPVWLPEWNDFAFNRGPADFQKLLMGEMTAEEWANKWAKEFTESRKEYVEAYGD